MDIVLEQILLFKIKKEKENGFIKEDNFRDSCILVAMNENMVKPKKFNSYFIFLYKIILFPIMPQVMGHPVYPCLYFTLCTKTAPPIENVCATKFLLLPHGLRCRVLRLGWLCTFFVYVLVRTARIVPSHIVAERMERNSPVGWGIACKWNIN